MQITNLLTAGGIVMIPLLFFSVLVGALIIERMRFWVKINSRQNRVVQEVLKLYRRDNVVGALEKLKQNTDLPIARIFLAALELEEANPEEFRLALESEAQAEIPLLKRFQKHLRYSYFSITPTRTFRNRFRIDCFFCFTQPW